MESSRFVLRIHFWVWKNFHHFIVVFGLTNFLQSLFSLEKNLHEFFFWSKTTKNPYQKIRKILVVKHKEKKCQKTLFFRREKKCQKPLLKKNSKNFGHFLVLKIMSFSFKWKSLKKIFLEKMKKKIFFEKKKWITKKKKKEMFKT